jgi:hypothetical protein
MKNKKIFYLVIPFAIVLYLGVFAYARNSEGFRFIQQEYLNSDLIEKRIGKVKSVELPVLGSFREKHTNSKVVFTAQVRCVGEKGNLIIDVVAEKELDWKIIRETIN